MIHWKDFFPHKIARVDVKIVKNEKKKKQIIKKIEP